MTNSNQSNAPAVATPTVTLQEMIARANLSSVPHGDIDEAHFGPEALKTGSGAQVARLSKEQTNAEELAKLGFKHASLGDFLKYLGEHRDLCVPGNCAIVARGSVATSSQGKYGVYAVVDNAGRRTIHRFFIDEPFDPDRNYFLVVEA